MFKWTLDYCFRTDLEHCEPVLKMCFYSFTNLPQGGAKEKRIDAMKVGLHSEATWWLTALQLNVPEGVKTGR